MGPQGDLGSHHLVRLSGVCALPANTHSQAEARFVGTAHFFRTLADVLVGYQLLALSPRLQRSCLQHAVVDCRKTDFVVPLQPTENLVYETMSVLFSM